MEITRLGNLNPSRVIKGLLVVSIVAPILVFAIAAWQGYHAVFAEATERADRINRLLEEHAAKTLETIVLLLRSTDQKVRDMDDAEIAKSRPLWDSIRELQETVEQANSIFIVDKDGINTLTTRNFPAEPLEFSDRDYWYEQRDHDRGVYVGRTYTGRISNRVIFNLAIRASDPTGRFDGVIGSSAYVDYFENFYKTAGDVRDNPAISLLRDDGMRLVGFPIDDPASGMERSQQWAKSRQAASGSFWSDQGGIERLYTFRKVANYPVVVTYGIDKRTILARWYTHLMTWGMVTFLVALALSSLCLVALRRTRHESEALVKAQSTSAELRHEIQRRERAEKALRESQKLDAMGQVTGGIAHDFNNLLMVILGSLGLAERRTDLDGVRKQLPKIRYAAERAEQLTRQLLAFARRQNLHPETLDIADCLRGYRSVLEQAIGNTVSLKLNVAKDVWPIRVDPAEFEVALLNLAVNARDAMPKGGSLTISAENIVVSHSDGRLKPGFYAHIALTDTGTGIEPEILARVFEPFFTTKDVNKGTGLGMSQVHGFIQQSDGMIDISSTVGQGTTISLYLPRSEQPFALAAIPAEAHPLKQSGHILVVEDNEEVGEVSVALLEEAGFQTTITATAAKALKLIEDGQHFDLLLSDIVMPGGMNGVELAKIVRGKWPHLPIVLMTGYAGIAAMEDIKGFSVVSKPVTLETLIKAINAELMQPVLN